MIVLDNKEAPARQRTVPDIDTDVLQSGRHIIPVHLRNTVIILYVIRKL